MSSAASRKRPRESDEADEPLVRYAGMDQVPSDAYLPSVQSESIVSWLERSCGAQSAFCWRLLSLCSVLGDAASLSCVAFSVGPRAMGKSTAVRRGAAVRS